MDLSEKEQEILRYWRENKIFEQTLAKTKKGKPFVFYEGPPYANGKPGIHHVLARAFKDIILRFKTMQGYYVVRKAGWDTHGLPTEMEVEKKLGVHTKKEIEEKIGIENFIEEARKNVFFYKEEWERLTERMAYWLDLAHPYVTMTNDYIEGLWWVFSQIARNGYLYKDYKVLPWCPRCETSLSSHELAQGYKKIKEGSVYIKFPIKQPISQNSRIKAYMLAWTTTPWTLPGNVALAVNPRARYVTIEAGGEWLILARERLAVINGEYKIISEEDGERLVGVEYEHLYRANSQEQPANSNLYRVVGADFVSTEDGTGIVHIAPAFGVDDQKIGKEYGLPTLVTVSEDGRMQTSGAAWHGTVFSEANPLIIKNLEARKLLYKVESYEHDYPFCWRCKSALMYYAKNSWFLKTTAVKKRMIEENKKINWRPDFVGSARFGEWLKENVDWAISRERYWGMPLPIWICGGCEFVGVMGSLEDLDDYKPEDGTEVYVMRHGEAIHNTKGVVGPSILKYDRDNHLTSKGQKQIKAAVKKLKEKKIDLIISSPLARARETAEIISKELGFNYKVHDQLFDIDVGEMHGRSVKEVDQEFPHERRFGEPFPGGESLRDARVRMMKAFFEISAQNKGKKILVISHGDPLWLLKAALDGAPEAEYRGTWYPKTGEVRKLPRHNWPYSLTRGELDLHRPYIDEIVLECGTCHQKMQRVSSVADVWFDSGSMPFAQNSGFWKNLKNSRLYTKEISKIISYPADYICEGADQTRGWFYTLLAVASLLKLPAPLKNVIVNGLLLDEKGEKMSKSRGNIVEPFQLFDKYGADAVRWYFFTINQPWDEKLFREEDVKRALRQFLMILVNSVEYWKTYRLRAISNFQFPISKLLINKWLVVKLAKVKLEVTKALEDYDVVKAARTLESFVIDDISHWYIRRIREVMKTGKAAEKKETSNIFGFVLMELAKTLAPFVPFVADGVYRDLGGKERSVHLEKWSGSGVRSKKLEVRLLENMRIVRYIVSQSLELRAEAGIKVRQPLAKLKVKSAKLKVDREFLDLIKGEVNVKEIVFDPKIKEEIELDTKITAELKEEGVLRDLIRHIQDMRKKAGLSPKDKIDLGISGGDKLVRKFVHKLKKEVGAKNIAAEITNPKLSSEFKADEFVFKIEI